MGWRRLVGAAVLALGMSLVTVVAPGAAQAANPGGSIVFIKGGNVWLVKPDGSGQHQVTTNGSTGAPYRSPSMSDAGIIAASHINSIVVMRQNGQVVRTFNPPSVKNSAGDWQSGSPAIVQISPNGQRIAYSFIGYSCPSGLSCGIRTATGVVRTNAPASTVASNVHYNPSWVTDNRLMTHDGSQYQMMLQDVGSGAQHWYDDDEVAGELNPTDLDDGAVSRDGSRLAVVRDYGASTHLGFYAVNGNVRTGAVASLPPPSRLCFTNADERIASPSWAPDNRTLVVQDSAGLVIAAEGGGCGGMTFRAIAPGGSEPHWSRAALNPGKKAAGTKAKAKKLKAKKRPKIKGKPRVGKKLKATKAKWSAKPRKLKYRWFRNGKAIKGKKGAKRVYKVQRADRGKRLQVRIVAKRPGFKAAKVKSKPVRVRR